MPIFEYLCQNCNRIYSFLSLSLAPGREPVCPRCGATGLTRVPSTFAVGGPRKSSQDQPKAKPGDDAALGRLEQEAMRMAGEIDEKDAEDPRTMARMMRRLAEASGEPVTPAMNEMFRRMEAGEDPEALEEELGPQLEAELGEDGEGGMAGPTRDEGLYDL
ncbi:MAG: FmdB family zinc ribbon protein [Acidobacteriota bacterium]